MKKIFLLFLLVVLSSCYSRRSTETPSVRGGVSTRPTVGFIFFGDFGIATQSQYDVADSMKSFCGTDKCEFGLLLGDNFYPFGVRSVDDKQFETKFQKPYAQLGFPFYVSLGNHDYGGNVNAQVEYTKRVNNWILPARFHKFTKENIEFFAIDTNDFNSNQAKWLEDGLKASKAEWKIVFGHHPIYSYGQHGMNSSLKRSLLPILTRNHVNFYLAGHDHDLQVLSPDETVNFIVSGAAAQTRRVSMGEKTLYSSDELGFMHLLISGKSATLLVLDGEGKPSFEKPYALP